MGKCNISIKFDREDRAYRGGERVTGQAIIEPNKDMKSNGILLEYFWRTHGRGNKTTGRIHKTRLTSGESLVTGKAITVPFEFRAARWPLTQRGSYVSVDHYVKVSVDVPFAFDPKQENDFIVLPGEMPTGMPTSRDETTKLTGATKTGKVPIFLMVIFCVLFAAPFLMMSMFLLPIAAIAGLVFGIRYWLARSQVGDVELTIPHVVIAPGEDWTCQLSFIPKRSFNVNEIIVTVEAVEKARRGSGTDATTYTNTLFKEVKRLHPQGQLTAGQPFNESMVISIPETTAYTLNESDNKVNWSATARIDIPRCPDWKKKIELQMLPLEFVRKLDSGETVTDQRVPDTVDNQPPAYEPPPMEPATQAPSPSPPVKEASSSHEPPPAYEPPTTTPPAEDVELTDEETVAAAGDSITKLVAAIQAKRRFGSERSDLIAAAAERVYPVRVTIDRVTSTYGLVDRDPDYEEGRTVIGNINGTDQEVQLFAHVESNSSLEMLSRGDTWKVAAKLDNWDTLYNRIVLREVR